MTPGWQWWHGARGGDDVTHRHPTDDCICNFDLFRCQFRQLFNFQRMTTNQTCSSLIELQSGFMCSDGCGCLLSKMMMFQMPSNNCMQKSLPRLFSLSKIQFNLHFVWIACYSSLSHPFSPLSLTLIACIWMAAITKYVYTSYSIRTWHKR